MLIRRKGEGIWLKCEFFCVIKAEKEVGQCIISIIDDFDGLMIVSSKLYYFWFNCNKIRSHILLLKLKTIIITNNLNKYFFEYIHSHLIYLTILWCLYLRSYSWVIMVSLEILRFYVCYINYKSICLGSWIIFENLR